MTHKPAHFEPTTPLPYTQEELEALNLDCFVDPDELDPILARLEATNSADAILLWSYACLKQGAMRAWLRGWVEIALMFENLCDRAYREFPDRLLW